MRIVIQILAIAVFSASYSVAQMLDNSKGEVFTDAPFFNTEFIKENQIKSLSGKFINYKLGDKLRDTKFFRKYNFNKEGLLISEIESRFGSTRHDTMVRLYEYDKSGNVSMIKQSDSYGYYLYLYEYDDENRLTHYEYRRKYDNASHPRDIHLGKEHKVNSESYVYERYGNQVKQIVYNENKAPYKEVIFYYDSLQNLTGKFEQFVRTNRTSRTTYTYNDRNLVDTVMHHSRIGDEYSYTYVFDYDESNNLFKKEIYKNEDYITQYQVIYHDETGFINDLLIQDIESGHIKVIELRSYEFFTD